jgi:hypothetical protein
MTVRRLIMPGMIVGMLAMLPVMLVVVFASGTLVFVLVRMIVDMLMLMRMAVFVAPMGVGMLVIVDMGMSMLVSVLVFSLHDPSLQIRSDYFQGFKAAAF